MSRTHIEVGLDWRRLISLADEMAASVARTAFSTVVREANDYACAVLTAEGDLVAQYAQSIPSFTGTLPATCRHFLAEFENDIRPGDVFITNDPWLGTGHLPDMTIVTPFFVDGELVAFCGSVAHMADIGGTAEAATARDCYQEGLCLPPARLVSEGVVNDELVRLIRHNVRIPDVVIGDIMAVVSANHIGTVRLQQFVRDRGARAVDEVAAVTFELAERAARLAVAELPCGVYRSNVRLDGIGRDERIAATVRIDDAGICVDFAGTSPQSRSGINSVLQYSIAYALYGLKTLLIPSLPNSAGTYRPFRVEIPEGTLLNPTRPAPVGARYLTAHFIHAALNSAFAEVIPERVSAHSGNPFWALGLKGDADGGPFASTLCFNGGEGAPHGRDGYPCLSIPSNIANTPVEVAEAELPLRFERRARARGTGGAGRWFGGDGQEVSLHSISDEPMALILLTERLEHSADGVCGGEPGAVGDLRLDGHPVADAKGWLSFEPGSRLDLRTPGGGGYGRAADV